MKFSTSDILNTTTDTLVLLYDEAGKHISSAPHLIHSDVTQQINTLIEQKYISLKENTVATIPCLSEAHKSIIVVSGIKPLLSGVKLSKLLDNLTAEINKSNFTYISCDFSAFSTPDTSTAQVCGLLTRQLTLSTYKSNTCKSKKGDPSPSFNLHFLAHKNDIEATSATIRHEQAIAHGMNVARELGNLPGNICTPTYLAEQAIKLANEFENIETHVVDEAEMEALGMGALLSVSRGSVEPAKLISIRYNGTNTDDKPIVIIGKGITFDTGGISLKAGPQMDEMKYDMCGAASVFGLLNAVIELQLPINIIGVITSAENMPSGTATKPGDIVTTMSGQTVEVLNTDAEGRLVLCDALTWVQRTLSPSKIIDIATLTGACVATFGNILSGLMSNNQDFANNVLEAGKTAKDKAWQLPIYEEYNELLDSNFADIPNIGPGFAGTITAACFLNKFIENDTPWVHLDIAGTAWNGGTKKGATGRPVPMLTQFLINTLTNAK